MSKYRYVKDAKNQSSDPIKEFLKTSSAASYFVQEFDDFNVRTLKADVAFKSGIISLDKTVGGFPSGFTEVYGEESSGKTAILGHSIAWSQRHELLTALYITEVLDSEYLERLGIDLGQLVLVRGHMDDVFSDLADFVSEPGRLLVIDSLTAARPRGDSEASEWAGYAYEFIVGLRKVLPIGSAVMVSSQSRARMSLEPDRVFTCGTESASRRIKDLFDVSLEISRVEVHDDNYWASVKVESNLLGKPGTMLELPIKKGYGVDLQWDLINVAVSCGVLFRKGPAFYLKRKDESIYLATGVANTAEVLRAEPTVEEFIRTQL